jgi:hypothetical protein
MAESTGVAPGDSIFRVGPIEGPGNSLITPFT